MVAASSIKGRSSPSTERAVVVRVSRPSSIRLMTVRAVSPLVPLAIPNRVSTFVRNLPAPMRETVGLDERDLGAQVDTDDA
jgi:hypothetical protein